MEAFENHEVLKAKVTQVLNGGLSVVVEETRVFIPASLVYDVYEKDLSKYADQEIEFVITEFNPRRRRIIGDRKQLIVAEKKKLQEELFARIAVGDVVEGTVKNVTDFGAGTFQLILFHLLRRIHLSYFLNNLMHQPAHLPYLQPMQAQALHKRVSFSTS